MLQDKDIFTIFAAGLEGTASPLYEIKNTIVKKDPKMQKTSNLTRSYAGHLLTTIPLLRKFFSMRCGGKIGLQVPRKRLLCRQPDGVAQFVVPRGQNVALVRP